MEAKVSTNSRLQTPDWSDKLGYKVSRSYKKKKTTYTQHKRQNVTPEICTFPTDQTKSVAQDLKSVERDQPRKTRKSKTQNSDRWTQQTLSIHEAGKVAASSG